MSDINIIYLLPEMKGASGGAKVIYNHSLIINKLDKNISSKIIHLKKKFSYKFELSLSKRIKFFNNKYSGWDGKKMKISKRYRPQNNWYENKISIGDNINFNKKKRFYYYS